MRVQMCVCVRGVVNKVPIQGLARWTKKFLNKLTLGIEVDWLHFEQLDCIGECLIEHAIAVRCVDQRTVTDGKCRLELEWRLSTS